MTSDDDRTEPADARGREIVVECLSCGRRSTLDPALASEQPLVQLTRRLKCSECGSRAVKASRVETPRDVARLLRARMRSGRS